MCISTHKCDTNFRDAKFFEHFWSLKYFKVNKILQTCAALLLACLEVVLYALSHMKNTIYKSVTKETEQLKVVVLNSVLYTVTVFQCMSTSRNFLLNNFPENAHENWKVSVKACLSNSPSFFQDRVILFTVARCGGVCLWSQLPGDWAHCIGVLEPRSCGLLCALLSGPGHDPNIVEFHFTSLPGVGEKDLFSGFWKERHSFPSWEKVWYGVEKVVGTGHGLSV